MYHLLPSDVARLVLGYLKESGLKKTFAAFLKESPNLSEYWRMLNAGQDQPATVMGMTLQDVLDEWAELSIKVRKLSAQVARLTGNQNQVSIPCNRSLSTPVVTREDIDMVLESHAKTEAYKAKGAMRQRARRAGSSKQSSKSDVDATVETHGPEQSNLSTQLVHQSQTPVPPSSAATATQVTLASDTDNLDEEFDFGSLDKLLAESKFHEKLAESINRTLKRDQSASSASKPLIDESEPKKNTEEVASSITKPDVNLKKVVEKKDLDNIISMTAAEPALEQLLSLFNFQTDHHIPVSTAVTSTFISNAGDTNNPLYTASSPQLTALPTASKYPTSTPHSSGKIPSTGLTNFNISPILSTNATPILSANATPMVSTNATTNCVSKSGNITSKPNPTLFTSSASDNLYSSSLSKTNSVVCHKKSENVISGSFSKSVTDKVSDEKIESQVCSHGFTHKHQSCEQTSALTTLKKCSNSLIQGCRKSRVKRSPKKLERPRDEMSNNILVDHSIVNGIDPVSSKDPVIENLVTENDNIVEARTNPDDLSQYKQTRQNVIEEEKASLCKDASKSSQQHTASIQNSEASNQQKVSLNSREQNASERHHSKATNIFDIFYQDIPESVIQNRDKLFLTTSTPVTAASTYTPSEAAVVFNVNDKELDNECNHDTDQHTHYSSPRETRVKTPPPQFNDDQNSMTVFSFIKKAAEELSAENNTCATEKLENTVPNNEKLSLQQNQSPSAHVPTPDNDSSSSFEHHISTHDKVYVKLVEETSSVGDNYKVIDSCLMEVLTDIKPSQTSQGESKNLDMGLVPKNNSQAAKTDVEIEKRDGNDSKLKNVCKIQDVNNTDEVQAESINQDMGLVLKNNSQAAKTDVEIEKRDGNDSKLKNVCKIQDVNTNEVQDLNTDEVQDVNADEVKSCGNFRKYSDKEKVNDVDFDHLEDFDFIHGSSKTISTPFLSKTSAFTDNSPRKLCEDRDKLNESISMPPSVSSLIRDQLNRNKLQTTSFKHNASDSEFKLQKISPKIAFYNNSRKVIACNATHSPFIPKHCKMKAPTRRITPMEVSYSTPSPLGLMSPSSPANFVIDLAQTSPSQPNTPLKNFNSQSPRMGKQMQENDVVSFNSEKVLPVTPENFTKERRHLSLSTDLVENNDSHQPNESPSVSLTPQHDSSLPMPLSPSRRKPKRIVPTLISRHVSKVPSESFFSSSSCSLNSSSFGCHDETKIVSSSTHPINKNSDDKAFEVLKEISLSYRKPQPSQEITSSNESLNKYKLSPCRVIQKCGCPSRENCPHIKGKKRKIGKEQQIKTNQINDNVNIKGSEEGVKHLACDSSSKLSHNKVDKLIAFGEKQTSNELSGSGDTFLPVGIKYTNDDIPARSNEFVDGMIAAENGGTMQASKDLISNLNVSKPMSFEFLNEGTPVPVRVEIFVKKRNDASDVNEDEQNISHAEIVEMQNEVVSAVNGLLNEERLNENNESGCDIPCQETAINKHSIEIEEHNHTMSIPYFPELSNTVDIFKLKKQKFKEIRGEQVTDCQNFDIIHNEKVPDNYNPTNSSHHSSESNKMKSEISNFMLNPSCEQKSSSLLTQTMNEYRLPLEQVSNCQNFNDMPFNEMVLENHPTDNSHHPSISDEKKTETTDCVINPSCEQTSSSLLTQAMKECGLPLEAKELSLMGISPGPGSQPIGNQNIKVIDILPDRSPVKEDKEVKPIVRQRKRKQARSKTTVAKYKHPPSSIQPQKAVPNPPLIAPSLQSHPTNQNICYYQLPGQAAIPFGMLMDGKLVLLPTTQSAPSPPPIGSTPFSTPLTPYSQNPAQIQQPPPTNAFQPHQPPPVTTDTVQDCSIITEVTVPMHTATQTENAPIIEHSEHIHEKVKVTKSKKKKKNLKKRIKDPTKEATSKKVKEKISSPKSPLLETDSNCKSVQKIATRRRFEMINSSPKTTDVVTSTYFKKSKRLAKRRLSLNSANKFNDDKKAKGEKNVSGFINKGDADCSIFNSDFKTTESSSLSGEDNPTMTESGDLADNKRCKDVSNNLLHDAPELESEADGRKEKTTLQQSNIIQTPRKRKRKVEILTHDEGQVIKRWKSEKCRRMEPVVCQEEKEQFAYNALSLLRRENSITEPQIVRCSTSQTPDLSSCTSVSSVKTPSVKTKVTSNTSNLPLLSANLQESQSKQEVSPQVLCDVCGRTFKSLSAVNSHMRTHSNPRHENGRSPRKGKADANTDANSGLASQPINFDKSSLPIKAKLTESLMTLYPLSSAKRLTSLSGQRNDVQSETVEARSMAEPEPDIKEKSRPRSKSGSKSRSRSSGRKSTEAARPGSSSPQKIEKQEVSGLRRSARQQKAAEVRETKKKEQAELKIIPTAVSSSTFTTIKTVTMDREKRSPKKAKADANTIANSKILNQPIDSDKSSPSPQNSKADANTIANSEIINQSTDSDKSSPSLRKSKADAITIANSEIINQSTDSEKSFPPPRNAKADAITFAYSETVNQPIYSEKSFLPPRNAKADAITIAYSEIVNQPIDSDISSPPQRKIKTDASSVAYSEIANQPIHSDKSSLPSKTRLAYPLLAMPEHSLTPSKHLTSLSGQLNNEKSEAKARSPTEPEQNVKEDDNKAVMGPPLFPPPHTVISSPKRSLQSSPSGSQSDREDTPSELSKSSSPQSNSSSTSKLFSKRKIDKLMKKLYKATP